MPLRYYMAVLVLIMSLVAQTPQPSRVLGTVQAVEPGGLTLLTDQKESVAVANDGKAKVQKVAPGAKDLSQAQEVQWLDLASGDRVLVRGRRTGEVLLAESVVLMSAREIAKRNDDARREWTTRGVAGLVDKVNTSSGEITLLVRGPEGMKPMAVQAANASFLRYAKDSVRFADTKESTLAEVKKGDQLRALGDKSADNTTLKAEKILFGTFRSVAGEITSVDSEHGAIEIKDAQSGKKILVKTKAESQLKRLPSMAGGFPGAGAGQGRGPGAGPGGPGGPAGPGAMMRPGGGAPDLSAMIERMPPSKFSEFQVGETIIASAAADQPGELTAFLILGNAGGLLARLTAAGNQGSQRGAAGGPSMGSGMGMGSGFGGLDSMMGMPNLQ